MYLFLKSKILKKQNKIFSRKNIEKYYFMIILIIPMLNQNFSSLHKEFIGESNILNYAVVLTPSNENSVCAFMFLQGTCCLSKYLNTSYSSFICIDIILIFIFNLHLAPLFCFVLFKHGGTDKKKKVSFFYMYCCQLH